MGFGGLYSRRLRIPRAFGNYLTFKARAIIAHLRFLMTGPIMLCFLICHGIIYGAHSSHQYLSRLRIQNLILPIRFHSNFHLSYRWQSRHDDSLSSCLFFSVFSVFSVFLESFCFFSVFDFFSVFSVFSGFFTTNSALIAPHWIF